LFASGTERTEALRGVLNAGNRRGTDVIRCVSPNHTPTPFKVFSPKALGGIDAGRLPETVRDRSVTLRLKRKVSSERVERLLWPKVRPDADALRDRIAAWGGQHVERLAAMEPALPTDLDDRAAEAWWALLAIADLAGGEWPRRARRAAVELHAAGVAEEESRGAQLLTDLRTVFTDSLAMFSRDVLDALNALDESPWGAWHEGKGLRARDLAKRLKPFGVKSRKVKIGGESLQGYHRDDLEEPWERYLPAPGEPPEPGPVYRASQVPFAIEVPEPQTETEPETPHSKGEVPEVPEVAAGGLDEDVARAEALAEKHRDLHDPDAVVDLFAGVSTVRRPRRERPS
jgi:hypothetical protein